MQQQSRTLIIAMVRSHQVKNLLYSGLEGGPQEDHQQRQVEQRLSHHQLGEAVSWTSPFTLTGHVTPGRTAGLQKWRSSNVWHMGIEQSVHGI